MIFGFNLKKVVDYTISNASSFSMRETLSTNRYEYDYEYIAGKGKYACLEMSTKLAQRKSTDDSLLNELVLVKITPATLDLTRAKHLPGTIILYVISKEFGFFIVDLTSNTELLFVNLGSAGNLKDNYAL